MVEMKLCNMDDALPRPWCHGKEESKCQMNGQKDYQTRACRTPVMFYPTRNAYHASPSIGLRHLTHAVRQVSLQPLVALPMLGRAHGEPVQPLGRGIHE